MTLAWHLHVGPRNEDLMRAQTPPKGTDLGWADVAVLYGVNESLRRFRCAWSIWHHELASNKAALTGWQVLVGVMLGSWTEGIWIGWSIWDGSLVSPINMTPKMALIHPNQCIFMKLCILSSIETRQAWWWKFNEMPQMKYPPGK